jgi:hypothetical protein
MLALAYSNDTLDIYDGAVCYMFYRFFEYGVGMVWARILLPGDLDEDQISVLFNSLRINSPRSFDYWSADSRLHEFAISRYLRGLNNDLNFWYNESVKDDLMARYQVRKNQGPVIVYGESGLFDGCTDPEIARVYRDWMLARLFASGLRNILNANSWTGNWLFPNQLATVLEHLLS